MGKGGSAILLAATEGLPSGRPIWSTTLEEEELKEASGCGSALPLPRERVINTGLGMGPPAGPGLMGSGLAYA